MKGSGQAGRIVLSQVGLRCVLAGCLHPLSGKWEFQFVLTRDLDPHPTCTGRLSEKVVIDGGRWTKDLMEVLI